MRTVLVRLIGTVVAVGALLVLAPAAATASTMEFLFGGGDEPFGGTPQVGMSMTGTDPKKPTKVTDFAVTGFDWVDCGAPGETSPAGVERVPIEENAAAAHIKRTKNKELYFSWDWEQKCDEHTLQSYQLVGGQNRKDPRVWVGKVRIRLSEGGIELGYCAMGAPTPTASCTGQQDWSRPALGHARPHSPHRERSRSVSNFNGDSGSCDLLSRVRARRTGE